MRDGAAADAHVLRRLQEQPRALDLVELRAQPRDDLVGVGVALVARLQRDEHAPVIERVAAAADRHRDMATSGSSCTISPSSS